MKKLAFLVAIILLGIIAFFKYKSFQRFNPPTAYDYPISEAIDLEYHDQTMVKDYYLGAYEIGNFARRQWYNKKVDVLFPNEKKAASMKAGKVYGQMMASVKHLEATLIRSRELKKLGLDNPAIEEIERTGIPAERYKFLKGVQQTSAKYGDKGPHIVALQKALNKDGFEIKEDGFFSNETRNSIMEYQKRKGLFPNGIADEEVFYLLFNN